MGIFEWLFGKGTNKDIERKERFKKRLPDKLKIRKENAKKEAFLNENKKILCDDGVERLWFYNKNKIIEESVKTIEVNEVKIEDDKKLSEADLPFFSNIEVKKWFSSKGKTLSLDEIILYNKDDINKQWEEQKKSTIKVNLGFQTGRKLIIINNYLFEIDIMKLVSGKLYLFSGIIDKVKYENSLSINNNSADKKSISFNLIDDKKLEINDKSQDERIGFFVEEINYNSVNEIIYRLGKQYKDGEDWYQEENTDELITFFTDKDDKFINFPENFEEEVVTSYDNGAYCISELNKIFLEHHKQYNITNPKVYDKKQILKILKDIKYQ